MSLSDHAEALEQHIPGLRIDVLLAHARAGMTTTAPEGHRPLLVDESRLRGSVGAVVQRDLGDEMAGHDPHRLAAAVEELLAVSGAAGRTS